MAAMTCAFQAPVCKAPVATKASIQKVGAARAPTFTARTVSNGMRTRQMLVWTPNNNKFFETFSYLPPLSDEEISKQVDYIVNNGWTPTLEFEAAESAYVASHSTVRFGGSAAANYYDNRYWTMWKLPMFGCTDPSQVLAEIQACTKAFPDAYIRIVAFDAVRQVQIAGFLVHRPPGQEQIATDKRSV
jgi:ribulose-bisphosphate carboxylase small chain